MHSIVFAVVVACLTVQVLEGSFIIPYILVHFGYPDLSMKEICDEMYIIVYKNEERECNFPYPLFSGPEPWKYKDMTDVIGKPAPPRPHYGGFGFREVVERHAERMARKAAEAAAAEKVEKKDIEEQRTHDPLSIQMEKSDTEGITANNLSVSAGESVDYKGNNNGN